MKKLLSVVFSCVMVLLVGATFAACGKGDDDTVIYDESQNAISMVVGASNDGISISLDSQESEVGTATAKIVSVKAYQYLEADEIVGMSLDVVKSKDAKIVGEYKLGTQQDFWLQRFDEGYDRLYDKYYVVYEDKILKGPVYTTQIEAQRNAQPLLDIKSKKGVLGENVDYFKDLNCSYATLNFEVEKLMYPNEGVLAGGGTIEFDAPLDNFYEFVSNGKTYYFRKDRVDHFDRYVKSYYDAGAHVTAIIYAVNNYDQISFPQKFTYDISAHNVTLMGLNTSNEYGFGYLIAMMEFFAERYTRDGFENGYIGNFVMGNEIDYAQVYNRIADTHQPLNVYMEEYSRLLRLTNLAVKKYNSNITVCAPFTQWWSRRYTNLSDSYAPKDMIEWLNAKTKMEGDFNWGIAPHCYPYGLAAAEAFLQDTINGKKDAGMSNDIETTGALTFSNIELLDEYLNRDFMKCNGQVRPVYLTESGISSQSNSELDRRRQAGAVAAVWYKLSQLDFVKSFSYYRLRDHMGDGGLANFGLLDANGERKPAYQVYKYIDTQYSDYVAQEFLKELSYCDSEGKIQNFENGGIASYLDVLDVFGTGYDFSGFDWQKAKPVTCERVYEFEDKMDLSGVRFDSKNFLYDGTDKSIEVTGCPEGVEVSYSEGEESYTTKPTLREMGTKNVVATFTKGGEVVGQRKASITVSRLSTNKTVYEAGEKIFVTALRNDANVQLSSDAWVGIFKKGATPGNIDNNEISYYYHYFNSYNDTYARTFCLQDCHQTTGVSMGAGKYVIYYFVNGGYDYIDSVEIEVLHAGQDSGLVDLSDVSFESAEMDEGEAVCMLEISGSLPQGVSVEYENNTAMAAGSFQAKAIFKLGQQVLEERYAVLSVLPSDFQRLAINKDCYYEWEEILVTVVAPNDSTEKGWWVGLYAEADVPSETQSIYWYYAKDERHINGKQYNLVETSFFNTTREEFKNVPAGKYKIILFDENSTIMMQINFEVERHIVEEKGTLSIEKTTFSEGETIMVTATRPESALAAYWVGLYVADDDVESTKSIYWYNVVDNLHQNGEAVNIKLQNYNKEREEWKNLPAGSYKFVLFNSPNYTIDVTVLFEIEQAEIVGEGTLELNKDTYFEGEDILVTATKPENDFVNYYWVGVYAAEDDINTIKSIYWYGVTDGHVSGQAYNIKAQTLNPERAALKGLPAGHYKMVLFDTEGYTIAMTLEFEVVAVEITERGTLSTDKLVYEIGDDIMVTATKPEMDFGTYWVAIYLAGDVFGSGRNTSIYYYYIDENHVSGEAFNIRLGVGSDARAEYASLPAGKYKIVLFNTSGYTVETMVEIQIGTKEQQPVLGTLSTDKAEYAVGENIVVTTNCQTSGAWVGIYKAEDNLASASSIDYYYPTNGEGISHNLSTSGLEAGEYKLVLFRDGGYTVEDTLTITISDGSAA